MNVNVISPAGELSNVPENELQGALKYGYRLATENEIFQDLKREEYGEGFGNQLAAGLEGAASGATFGLSRHVENILGIATPESQAARKELNPWAAGVGEGAGILGSMFVLPGGGLTGLVGKGAARAGEGVAAGLAENAIAKQLVSKTVGGALEGMAYGTSAPISETALGDPTVTAQKAFSQIGLGALFGGGAGAAMSLLGMGARRALGKSAVGLTEKEAPKVATTLEGEATTVPQGPVKLEGTIDFGVPDEKILTRAEHLNPKNPLNQNDLDWLKANGGAVEGKPTVFDNIGSAETPTLNNAAKGQITMEDTVGQGMKKLQDANIELDAMKENILRGSDVTLPKSEYKQMIEDQIAAVEASGKAGDEIGDAALSKLNKTLELADKLPEDMTAMQIKERIDNIRTARNIYTKGGGIKDDFVSEQYWELQHKLDEMLKSKIGGYRKLMEEYAPQVNLSKNMEKHLNWDFDNMASNLKSDWVDNRVVKPFQSELYGNKSGGYSNDAKLLRQFGEFLGVDLDKAVKTNLVYGKLNPEAALGGQRGTWGARMAEGFDLLKHPTELPGKAISGVAKIAMTGEMPEFVTKMQARGIQDLLLGKSRSTGAVDSILSSMSGLKDSKIFGALGQIGVPATVKIQQYLDSHDTMEGADQQLQVLTGLEKAQNKADRAIDSAISGIFSGNKTHTHDYAAFLGKSANEDADDLEKLGADTNELVNNPEKLLNQLTQGLQGLGDHAPNVTMGLNMTAVRAVNFLAQKIGQIQPQTTKMPFDKKFVPSKMQLSSLAKTLKYLNAPYEVLKEIPSGLVSNEGKEVLSVVYPELYAELKGRVMNAIADAQVKGKPVPTHKRLGLSFFLDQPMDSSVKPMAIQANQAAFAMQMATQNTPKPSVHQPNASGRMMSGTEKIASRQ